MKKMIDISLFTICIILSFGCRSLPTPSQDEEILLILASKGLGKNAVLYYSLADERSEKHKEKKCRISPDTFSEKSMGYFTIPLGESIKIDLLRLEIPGEDILLLSDSLTLEKKSVNLYSAFIENSKGVNHIRSITPEIQRASSEYLTSYIDYFVWGGRNLNGFGAYEPRLLKKDQYEVSFNPDRDDLELWIDQMNWGTPPLTAYLDPGKHQIRYFSNKRELLRTFIEVQSDMKVEHQITLLDSGEYEPVEQDQYFLCLGELENLGGEEMDYLISLLYDSLRVQLDGNERLNVLSGNAFSQEYAEEQGAEFILQGSYLTKGPDIMIQIVLRDVQSDRILTGTQQVEILGLDIIKMMQESADEFASGVLRQLPPPGEKYYIQKIHFTENILRYEGDFAKRNTLGKRKADHPWSIGLGFNMGIIKYNSLETGASGEGISTLSGDPIPFPGIEMERYLGRNFLITDQFRFRLYIQPFEKEAADESGWVMIEPYHLFSNSLSIHYLLNQSVNGEFSFLLSEDTMFRSETEDNYGQIYSPQLNLALAAGMRFRYYLQNRIGENSHWPYLGIEYQYYLIDFSYYPQSQQWKNQQGFGNLLHLFIGRRF